MQAKLCEECLGAMAKGEPYGPGMCSRCKRNYVDRCDKCGDVMHQPYFTIGGKDYHLRCAPVKWPEKK